MRKWLPPLSYTFPLVVFFSAVMIYPFINMVFQGFLPAQDILETTADTIRKLEWKYLFSEGLTVDNYLSVFTDSFTRKSLIISLTLSTVVSFLSIALCIGPAWLLVRKEFPGKRLFRSILTIPMAFSGVIIGFLTVLMIGRIGMIPQITEWIFGVPQGAGLAYSFIGLGFAYIWFQIPRATLNLESAIRKFDWDLASAARSLGASPMQTFRYVLLPLLTPAIVSTMAVTFAVSMGSFGVALLLLKKSSVLPLEIYTNVYQDLAFELAAALSVVLAVITVGVNYVLRRYGEKNYAFAQR